MELNSPHHPDVSANISIQHPLIVILVPNAVRDAICALWQVDEECAQSMRASTETSLQLIRLIWWRDQLEGLATGTIVPTNPALTMIAEQLSADQILKLSILPDLWADFAEASLSDVAALERFCTARGALLFEVTAMLCETNPEPVSIELAEAGTQWAMADLASNLSDKYGARLLWENLLAKPMPSLPATLKMLSALTALARQRARASGQIRPFREQLLLMRRGIFG